MAALQLGAMLAPTAISGLSNLLGNNRQSPYERQLSRMATLFEQEGSAPVTQNREFKSGMKIVDERDRENRRAIDNQSAASGTTDEAKLGHIQTANRSRDSAIDKLLNNARRYRQIMQSRALQTSGMLEQARQSRNQDFQGGLQSIINPLGKAANAFVLSDMFSNDAGGGIAGDSAVAPTNDNLSGYINATRQGARNQVFQNSVWG